MRYVRAISRILSLRYQRERLFLRAHAKGHELDQITAPQSARGILLFCCIRNEAARLPDFLDHHRSIGVRQFFVIDNASEDSGPSYLARQRDVALFRTTHSYRDARYGMDWIDSLLARFGHDRWCLTVDADERFIYSNHPTRPLQALTAWLDSHGRRSMSALLLDLYPVPGQDRDAQGLDSLCHDRRNYRAQLDPLFGHDWVQGGPRERSFFAHAPVEAPALNKVPLVRWRRGYAHVSSTHHLLPRGLNRRLPTIPTGILLHTKLASNLARGAAIEVTRQEHYAGAREYRAYLDADAGDPVHPGATPFRGWRQLESDGLMSRGVWA